MNRKLKIGEFSKLCCVTVKTLRYYEEKKLLIPATVDEWTGYRFYNLCQSQQLNRILHLKGMGLSLDEIAEIFERGDDKPDVDTIRHKIEQCNSDIKKLERQLRQLQCLEELSTTKKKMEQMTIKKVPARLVASHRQVIKSYNDLGALCVNVLGPEMMRIGCTCPEPQYCFTVEHDVEHKEENIDVEYCEAVGEMHENTEILKFYEAPVINKALCYNHRGDYTTFSESMTKAMAYIEANGLQITGNPRFCYIDGPWNKQDEAEWLTEIQIPVA